MNTGWCELRKRKSRLARGILEEWLAHSGSRSSQPSVDLVSFAQVHTAAVLLVDEESPFEPGTARDASVIPSALDASFPAGRNQYLLRKSYPKVRYCCMWAAIEEGVL